MLEVACRLAKEAGEVVESVRLEGFQVTQKHDDSPVTRADLASDALVRDGLMKTFPMHSVLSEEASAHIGSDDFTWIIDPLDGTQGFIDDTPHYAVQIGLLQGNTPLLGVFYEPRTERLFYASRGQGAFIQEHDGRVRQLRVSSHQEPSDMRLVTSTTIPTAIRTEVLLNTGLSDGGTVRSVGCKVGKLVLQEADVYLSHHPVNYWDSCGPLMVLIEAGGKWTNLNNEPCSFDLSAGQSRHPEPFVVSNGQYHRQLCEQFKLLL